LIKPIKIKLILIDYLSTIYVFTKKTYIKILQQPKLKEYRYILR